MESPKIYTQFLKNSSIGLIDTCFNRVELQPVHDLRIQCSVFFRQQSLCTFLEIEKQTTTTFFHAEIPTARIKMK